MVPGPRGGRSAQAWALALRHTFASQALAAGVSIFQLARLMGASVEMTDRHCGHLVPDSEDALRDLLSCRTGVEVATEED